MSQSWNVIWQLEPDNINQCIEREWWRFLFADVPMESEVVDFEKKPLLQKIMSHPLVCASCPNLVQSDALADYVQRLPRPRVLFHMSDEYAKVGVGLYPHCDLVVRCGSALDIVQEAWPLIQVPLGVVKGFFNASGMGMASSERRYSYAFMGEMKNTDRRDEMLPAMERIPGGHRVRTSASWNDSVAHFDSSSTSIYQQSVFVPCPKGQWNPECNRLYDAMEWGCIPLIRNYKESEYHDGYHTRLLGKNPIPEFDTWKEGADFAADLLCRPKELDVLQKRIFDWWQIYKQGLQRTISDRMARLA